MKESTNERVAINHEIKSGLLSGLIASAISSLVLVLATMMAVASTFNYIEVQSSIFGVSAAVASWIIYFAMGIFVWGLLYIPLERKMIGQPWAVKGILYGLFIWILAMVVIMPIAGAGMFASKYEISAAILVLVNNLVYGLVLAYSYYRFRNY